MPSGWGWLALRRMPCPEGDSLTFFVARQNDRLHIYSNRQVSTAYVLHVAGEDVSREVQVREYHVHRAAFLGSEGLTICLGNEDEGYVTALVELGDLLEPTRRYKMSVFLTSVGWVEVGERAGEDLNQIASASRKRRVQDNQNNPGEFSVTGIHSVQLGLAPKPTCLRKLVCLTTMVWVLIQKR